REQQGDHRLLVPRVHLEHVQADALGGRWVVDDAVALRLMQRRWNARFRNALELVTVGHAPSLRLNTFISFPSGSKNSSTTRSLSGMIALSVMVMCSGQTVVQHLVMLQNPMPCAFRSASIRSSVSSGCISSAAAYTRNRGPMNSSCR